MKFKIVTSFVLIYSILFNQVFAQILFSEILPNTDDDKNLEYIELYNSGNLEQSLSGIILKDKSEKKFIFGSGEILGTFELKKYFREFTKILLNNSDEELFLYNNSGTLLDSFSYTGAIKNEKITIISFETGSLEIDNLEIDNLDINNGDINNNNSLTLSNNENNTGSINIGSGETLPGTTEENNIGSLDNNSGTGNSDEDNTGSINIGLGEILFGSIVKNNSGSLDKFNLIFDFQNPSYILEKDKILKTYICDNSKDECKLNLDLRNSFTGSFKEKDFECIMDFGFGLWLNGEENQLVIAGKAKMGEIEKYIVGIKGNKSGFIKLDLKKEKLDKKFGEILDKLIKIINEKYNKEQKINFKNKLIKIRDLGFGKFKNNEKIVYLVEKLIKYLK